MYFESLVIINLNENTLITWLPILLAVPDSFSRCLPAEVFPAEFAENPENTVIITLTHTDDYNPQTEQPLAVAFCELASAE